MFRYLHVCKAHTQFGPETALAPHSLRPWAYFDPVPTSARKQLWPNRLQPGDKSFKSVIYQFWPSIHLSLTFINQRFQSRPIFLFWSYQACNYSFKLVTCMSINLALDKIKLLKNLSLHLSIIYLTGLLIDVISLTFINQHFQSRPIF